MGLNDLTLERLVNEINGYKEKLRTIHEDYGRASQDLQDRINVLGYTLNEHLRETKDQIASTPQRLLTLETKYVTGEVNDAEYRNQREEFKGLLERNLHSIEEIKSMISVMQQIEVKPLTPAEFKQAPHPSSPSPTGEERERGSFSQNKPFMIPQPAPQVLTPPQAVIRTSSDQLGPEKTAPAETPAPTSSPSPPQPQSNGNNWTSPTPQPSNAAIPPATETATPETLARTPPSASLTEPTSAETHEPADDAIDDSVVTVPTVDIIEAPGTDDTLMVKVVDDLPSVDASIAVVSGETATLQPTSLGSTDAATVAPIAPDLAQVSLTPPTQFYKVVCPKCGADVPKPAKVWELKGGKSKKNVLIGLFQCQDCRVKFREALTREII